MGGAPLHRYSKVASWHLISGEYPPTPGGVSASSRLIAKGLIAAGDEVVVWTRAGRRQAADDEGIEVNRLPNSFGPFALGRLASRLRHAPASRLLVQYVPQAFGWKGMNWPFCDWLRRLHCRDLTVVFHEVAYPREAYQAARLRLLSLVTHRMARLAAQAATRIFVTTPQWSRMLRALAAGLAPILELPVFSNIPVVHDPAAVQALRMRAGGGEMQCIGHFGAFPRPLPDLLTAPLVACLRRAPARIALLFGYGSDRERDRIVREYPDLQARIHAGGTLSESRVSLHIQACDVMLQPYPDGATSRRGTLMAALAHGVPVVTTIGALSEPLWMESGAVAAVPVGDQVALQQELERLLASAQSRARLARAAGELYAARFDISHAIAALRGEI